MDEASREKRSGKDSAIKNKVKLPRNEAVRDNNHVVKKRAGRKFPKTGKDVYVRKKSNIKVCWIHHNLYLRITLCPFICIAAQCLH